MTGAGRNIGRGIAQVFAEAGAAVAVVDIDLAAAQETADSIRSRGGTALAVRSDLSDAGEVQQLFSEVEQTLGLPDVLVNNAYARADDSNWGSFLEIGLEDWRGFLDTNLAMMLLATQRFARGLVHASRTGTVVNIGSNGSDRAHRNHISYDTLKGALDSFTKAVAVDLAPWGIRVNTVRPGAVDLREDRNDATAFEQVPLGRGATPADIGWTAAFLAADASDYLTGQLITLDGGLLVQGRAPAMEGVRFATPATLHVDDPTRWPASRRTER